MSNKNIVLIATALSAITFAGGSYSELVKVNDVVFKWKIDGESYGGGHTVKIAAKNFSNQRVQVKVNDVSFTCSDGSTDSKLDEDWGGFNPNYSDYSEYYNVCKDHGSVTSIHIEPEVFEF